MYVANSSSLFFSNTIKREAYAKSVSSGKARGTGGGEDMAKITPEGTYVERIFLIAWTSPIYCVNVNSACRVASESNPTQTSNIPGSSTHVREAPLQ